MISRTGFALIRKRVLNFRRPFDWGTGQMERTTVWKSRPVFITSTFQDMQAERDHLRRFVFPALEEWLLTKRRHL